MVVSILLQPGMASTFQFLADEPVSARVVTAIAEHAIGALRPYVETRSDPPSAVNVDVAGRTFTLRRAESQSILRETQETDAAYETRERVTVPRSRDDDLKAWDASQRRPIANPAALGLGALALTTFVFSSHYAGLAPGLTWVGVAFFYGGLAQFTAGMWAFKTGNTFGATAFSTYGAFWLSLAAFMVLVLAGWVSSDQVNNDLGWFFLSFGIFNACMLMWSTRTNVVTFLIFLTLEVTQVTLALGFFSGSRGIIQVGGYAGIVTAVASWYGSAAIVGNSVGAFRFLPLGRPIWSQTRGVSVASARR